jgi:molecular chaperone HscA
MLLQIQEPEQGRQSKSNKKIHAVGIDLGTTNSLIAWVEEGNIRSLKEEDIIPSVVAYGPQEITVGKAALRLQGNPSVTVIRSVKRLMGKTALEEYALAFPFAQTQEEGTMARLSTVKGTTTPVEVSASILSFLKDRAEHQLRHTITHAVLTVPAYFDEAAKMATKKAAQLAGLEVLRLLNEPTAAALAYGLDRQCEGLYAVYDFGGGTFDISLLNLAQGVFQVVATAGDERLGGDDIDRAIAAQFRKTREDQGIIEQWDIEDYQQVLQQARLLKERLSSCLRETVEIKLRGKKSSHKVSREELNQWMEPFIRRTGEICEKVLKDKSISQKIQGVVLVGGSTRIPQVRTEVEKVFGLPPLTDIDPDRVVAWGAALQASALTEGSETLLLDVVPLSLGIETMGGLVERIIERNTPIPTQKSQQFTTFADFQQGILLNVVQGERETVEHCRSLGCFELKNIPPLPAGSARIEVTFAVDVDGLLTVTAQEKETGQKQIIEVKPLYGLSEEDMHRILRNSLEYRQADQQQRQAIEEQLKNKRTV